MDAKQSILATVKAMPNRKIEGKKRLQKLIHLLKLSGANIECEFRLHHYGPYSFEVAHAADILSAFGGLSEIQEPKGIYGTYISTYSVPDSPNTKNSVNWSSAHKRTLEFLDKYSTVELEIASTIGYFLSLGYSLNKAVAETKYIKEGKAQTKTVKRALEIIHQIHPHQ
jgi:hypothetical protein